MGEEKKVEKSETRQKPQNRKEEFYENLRGRISVRTLDMIIAGLFVCLIAVIVLGILHGNGA